MRRSISAAFASYYIGDEVEIAETSLLDWLVNDDDILHGGFSIRYYPATLREIEHEEYAADIGVTEYATNS